MKCRRAILPQLTVGTSLLLSFLTVAWVDACASEIPEPTDSDPSALEPVVLELLDWIGKHSDYHVGALKRNPPKVSFCHRDETISYEDLIITVHDPIKGLYDASDARVILVRPWTSDDPENVATLLHELVHFVQYSSKDWGDCWQKTELEAYLLQELWLEQRGLNPNFNWAEILLLSRCSGRHIHPYCGPGIDHGRIPENR